MDDSVDQEKRFDKRPDRVEDINAKLKRTETGKLVVESTSDLDATVDEAFDLQKRWKGKKLANGK